MSDLWPRIIEPTEIQASLREVRQFEDELGFVLPEDYRMFLLSLNGGKVTPEHEFFVREFSCNAFVNCLWPLTAPSPSLGIREARELQVKNGWGLRWAIKIGDDCGTGSYCLILDGHEKGAVFFVWDDDVVDLEKDALASETQIPKSMAKISSDFDSLAELILANSKWSPSS